MPFNIRQGTLPGRPGLRLNIAGLYVFENQDTTTERAILAEIQKIAGGDPRIYISDEILSSRKRGLDRNTSSDSS
jgi:hypothetical protein